MKDDDLDNASKPLTPRYREETSPVWDMSQERVFIEQLLNQRFNFFLILFSVTVAGAVNVRSQALLIGVLAIGLVIEALLALVLARSQKKLDLILNELKKDKYHPMSVIDGMAGSTGSKRRLIGIWIPRLCCTLLLLALAAAGTKYLVVPAGPSCTQPAAKAASVS